MATKKLRTPMKQQESLDYKLGQIDQKLESNEQAHAVITDTLKGISATLIDVRSSIATINAEANSRIVQERQIMDEVGDLCKQMLPIQTSLAATNNQIITNSGRISKLESTTAIIKTEHDRLIGKASVVGAVISAVVAGLFWAIKYFFTGHSS